MRRRKKDIIQDGLEMIIKSRVKGIWGVLLAGVLKKLLADLIAYLQKVFKDDMLDYPEDESEFYPDQKL